MKVVTGSQMAAIDKQTIESLGMPSRVLMENAARAVCRTLVKYSELQRRHSVLVICGSGNNGGDGFCVARILHGWGFNVTIAHVGRSQTLKPDPEGNLNLAREYGVPVINVKEEGELEEFESKLKSCDWVVDALFGTGLSRQVVGIARKVLEMGEGYNKNCIAVDVPSGVDSDTGQMMGPVIPAKCTVTFGLPKIGQLIMPGASLCGKLVVADIGFPKNMLEDEKFRTELTTANMVRSFLKPRLMGMYKGTNGKLALVGGSRGTLGAIVMAAKSALASGCGYVRIYVPHLLETTAKSIAPDIVSEGLPDISGGYFKIDATDVVIQRTLINDAMVIGPGVGPWDFTHTMVVDVLEESKIPAVIDADGLTALAREEEVERDPTVPWVLTPHIGEAGRLLKKKNDQIASDPVGSAKELALKYKAVVVLKGPRTITASPDGRMYINTTGNPVLAVMGAGDLLSGIIGSLLARGLPDMEAAACGVYIHGLMGDVVAEMLHDEGVSPSEMIDYIPEAVRRIRECEVKENFEILI